MAANLEEIGQRHAGRLRKNLGPVQRLVTIREMMLLHSIRLYLWARALSLNNATTVPTTNSYLGRPSNFNSPWITTKLTSSTLLKWASPAAPSTPNPAPIWKKPAEERETWPTPCPPKSKGLTLTLPKKGGTKSKTDGLKPSFSPR